MFSMQDIIKLMGPNSASYIEMSDQLGTLEAGKLADIVIVDGNPLDGYWNMLNTKLTIMGGEDRLGSALDSIVAAVTPASAWAQEAIRTADRNQDRQDRAEPVHAVGFGERGSGPPGRRWRPDRRARRARRHLHGRFAIPADRRQGAGGGQAHRSRPIRFLVNTHIHGDHTAGNATFAKLGAVLLAREELREGMARQPATTAPARRRGIRRGCRS